ncbi:chaplin family protein [Streptomyces sp. NPDC004752]
MMTAAVLGASSASLVLSSALGAAAAPAAPEDSGTGTSALSGSLLQLPLNIPVTVCGNTIGILGLEPLSSGSDNGCRHSAQPQGTDAADPAVGGAVDGVADGVAGPAIDGVAGGLVGDAADPGTNPEDLFLF